MDSSMVEYDPDANFAVKDSCRTRKPTGAGAVGRPAVPIAGFLIANLGEARELVLPAGYRRLELYDSQGRRVWAYGRDTRSEAQILRIPKTIGTGIFRIRRIPG